MGEEVGGTGGRGDRASDNEGLGRQWGGGAWEGELRGAGVGCRERSGLGRAENGGQRGRQRDASKLKEDGEGRADPEVLGGPACPPKDRGTSRHSGGTDASRACRVLSCAASPSPGNAAGDPGLGRECPLRRGEPVPWFAYDPRAPPRRLFSRFEAAPRAERDGADIVRSGLATAKSQGAERWDSKGGEGPGGAARSPGSRWPRWPAGGAELRRLCHPQFRARLGLRAAPPFGPH